MPLLLFFIKALSRLPLSWLYLFAGFTTFILKNVIGYRRAVIESNLKHSFPEKDAQEIKALANRYYRHLANQVVETLRLWKMSDRELLDRCRFLNPEVLGDLAEAKENVIIMMGHSGNWEWAGLCTQLRFDFQMIPVYRKIKNNDFDRFYRQLRSRFDAKPAVDEEAPKVIPTMPSPHAVALLADHSVGGRKGWWTTFLNRPAPFFRGSEILAKRLGYQVVFAHIRVKSRGRYEIILEKTPKTWLDEKYRLTKEFVRFLEREIEAQPWNWLWSHRRWKHQPHDRSEWMGQESEKEKVKMEK